MSWYQIGAGGLMFGVVVWLVVRGLDRGLDWLLQRKVKAELEELNAEARDIVTPLPRRTPGASLDGDPMSPRAAKVYLEHPPKQRDGDGA